MAGKPSSFTSHGWAWPPSRPPQSLEEALVILEKTGFIRGGDFDNETKADLKSLPQVMQMQSLIRFQEAVLHQKIKSKRYFFLILRRVEVIWAFPNILSYVIL